MREFLAAHHTLSLATDGPDGLWAATVFYVNDGADFYFMSDRETRHTKNVLATGRVAVTINGDIASWGDIRGLQFADERMLQHVRGGTHAQTGRPPESRGARLFNGLLGLV